ncbi:DUF2800 domain-containing protein [Corynebacterium cystitidis]|uniref:DUF2800 domain-containing protein n=1 Tax=Corynebacterium cystitidis TaxID=35757 RepID=UPI00211DB9C7|nr:DUF2800 domain-containing protein [Corynebacterium cystitidis]
MDYTPITDVSKVNFDDPIEHSSINAVLESGQVTHVRDTNGDVWKVSPYLNKKSVPLNHAGVGPQRLTFNKVESFGTIEETTGPAEGDSPQEPDETPAGETATAVAHADREHALLSASGANRWLNCTPSALLEEQYPDRSSDAAEEGTAAHELAEYKLRQLAGIDPGQPPTSDWHNEDMESHTDDYADHVMAELERTKETSPAAFLAIEQRLDFSHIVPDGFGTGDALIVGDGTMTIVDLKYGKGVKVDAEGNPQMRLYALGALRQFDMIYQIDTVRMVIFQPRLDNISVDEIAVTDLLEWADEVVKPAAALAINGEGELRAGDWCQFCRHAPQCTEQMKQHFSVIPTAGEQTAQPAAPDPDTLTDAQVAQIVTYAGDIKKWLTKVENYALDQANQGHGYEGLKLVEGRSVRKYTDEDAVAKAVQEAGEEPYEKKVLGITAMTKLLGKKKFDDVLGDLVHKPAGKPTLVPASDKRPALTVATPENVFTPIEAKE